jgi:hypothetical protein
LFACAVLIAGCGSSSSTSTATPAQARHFSASATSSGSLTPKQQKYGVGDYPESAEVTFNVGKGVKVQIGAGGAYPYTNCTSNEAATPSNFETTGNGQKVRLSYTARDGGSCASERSFATYPTTLSQGGKLIGYGTLYFGQPLTGGTNYYAYCQKGFAAGDMDWTGFNCDPIKYPASFTICPGRSYQGIRCPKGKL